MRAEMVEHLVCPETGAALSLTVQHRDADEILEGELVSQTAPARRYPIRGGIPRFVAWERLADAQRATVDSFSYKWARIPRYSADAVTKAHRERWYFQRFGFAAGDADLRAFLRSARHVLEAGTGTGVDTDLLRRNCQGTIFGIDISTAIETAYERFRTVPQIVLAQADIARLPFRPGFFDVISCDQVLHHTPQPPENFQRLARLLAPGGKFLLYVYRVKGALREYADDYLRRIFTQSSAEACVAFSEKMARLGRNLSRLQAQVEVADDIPELGIQRGRYDVQRLIYDHVLKCFWNEAFDEETNAMVNFDWYRPPHAFRYTEQDVRQWSMTAGLRVQHLHLCPSGISAIMERPA